MFSEKYELICSVIQINFRAERVKGVTQIVALKRKNTNYVLGISEKNHSIVYRKLYIFYFSEYTSKQIIFRSAVVNIINLSEK